eukprot:TRINITY_DN1222_c0_g1_i2.p1 TRINITY_DN1222_c0_g1~~TRINITY_DN1222_c0_g1_i2.p1  ORF type:complete len:223 (-),score=13.03 TRINITY_DN1222_c0_g1_i2:114-782(-)
MDGSFGINPETGKMLLSIVATGFALALGLSPYKTIQEIRQRGDTIGFQFFPLFMLLVNSIIQCLYAVFLENFTMIFVNSLNASFSCYFVMMFYHYSPEKAHLRNMLAGAAVAFVILVYHVTYRVELEDAKLQLGILSNISGIITFGSPLAAMATVIKTRDASSIPVVLSMAAFGCSVSWFLFGWTIDNVFVMTPNAIGAILSSIQLALVAIFGRRKTLILPD